MGSALRALRVGVVSGGLAAIVVASGVGAGFAVASQSHRTKHVHIRTTNVAIGIAAPAAEFLVPFLAQKEKLFAKEHIDATVSIIPSANLLTSIAGGKVQFGVFAAPQPDVANLAGAPIRWLTVWANHAPLRLVARPGITSVAQLKGRPVAMTAAGSTSSLLTNLALKRVGMNTNDVQVVRVTSASEQSSVFLSGEAVATALPPPLFNLLLAKVPGSQVIANFATSFPWTDAGLAGYMPWVRSHKAATVDFLKAIVAGVHMYQTQPAKAKAIIAQETGIPAGTLIDDAYTESLQVINDSFIPSPYVERYVLNAVSSIAPQATKVSTSRFIAAEYIKAALQAPMGNAKASSKNKKK